MATNMATNDEDTVVKRAKGLHHMIAPTVHRTSILRPISMEYITNAASTDASISLINAKADELMNDMNDDTKSILLSMLKDGLKNIGGVYTFINHWVMCKLHNQSGYEHMLRSITNEVYEKIQTLHLKANPNGTIISYV
jgi:hypothetical protein